MTEPAVDESTKQVVFTAKAIVAGSEAIKYVIHDSDGDWHFMPDHAVTAQDASVVSLADIVSLDPSVDNALGIPVGSIAERIGPQEWAIGKLS